MKETSPSVNVSANETNGADGGRIIVLTLAPGVAGEYPPTGGAPAAHPGGDPVATDADGGIGIDRALLSAIARRRARRWSVLAPLLFVLFVAGSLLFTPQQYETVVSLALQQPSGGTAAMLGNLSGGLLGGANGGPKAYQGVLKSRAFAEKAARAGDIARLYALPGGLRDATDLIQENLAVEDRKDGLLYLHVSLPGPARLAPGARVRRQRVRHAAARVANRYPELLRDYLEKSDVDRDSVLLRTATGKVERAQRDDDDAVAALVGFVRDGRGKAAGVSSAAADVLQTLYGARGQIEADIRAAEAAETATRKLLSASEPGALAALPGEDPLLAGARQTVRDAQAEMDRLRVDLADTHPDVVQARARLDLATQQMTRQANALRRGRTTGGVNLAALRARRAQVVGQIERAERRSEQAAAQSADREILRDRVALRLETLKELSSQAAVLGLQSVSGKNRLSVVDAAEMPRVGRPGLLFFLVTGLLATLLLLVGALAAEYLWHVARIRGAGADALVLVADGGDDRTTVLQKARPQR